MTKRKAMPLIADFTKTGYSRDNQRLRSAQLPGVGVLLLLRRIAQMPHHTSISITQAAESLAKAGTLSQNVASTLASQDRSIRIAEVQRGFEDPQMSCFLIDASPSMEPFTDAVIQGQHLMLDTLRGSKKCRAGQLYVGQWLFSGDVQLLNPFGSLSKDGSDDVPLLDRNSYRPQDGNGTALYETVFHVLQDMAANTAYGLQQHIRTSFTIGLITDGEDNRGGPKPHDIRDIVGELKQNGYLLNSVVIGIESRDLPRAKIEAIQTTLGFDQAVFVDQDPSGIRQAFHAASRSAADAQGPGIRR